MSFLNCWPVAWGHSYHKCVTADELATGSSNGLLFQRNVILWCWWSLPSFGYSCNWNIRWRAAYCVKILCNLSASSLLYELNIAISPDMEREREGGSLRHGFVSRIREGHGDTAVPVSCIVQISIYTVAFHFCVWEVFERVIFYSSITPVYIKINPRWNENYVDLCRRH